MGINRVQWLWSLILKLKDMNNYLKSYFIFTLLLVFSNRVFARVTTAPYKGGATNNMVGAIVAFSDLTLPTGWIALNG